MPKEQPFDENRSFAAQQCLYLCIIKSVTIQKVVKVNITNAANSEGVIIVDLNSGFVQAMGSGSGSIQTTLPVKVNRLEFEFVNEDAQMVTIGTTALAPTVNQNVTGFEFDPTGKTLKVMNGSTVVQSVSTNRTTILVRVDFNTATITVFQ